MFLQSNAIDLKKRLEQIEKNPSQPKPKPSPRVLSNAIGSTVAGALEAPADILSLVTPWEYEPDPLKKNPLTVDPEETGVIGQIGHGLMHSVSAFMTGGLAGGAIGGAVGFMAGGALGVFLAESRRAYENARDVGQDKETATAVSLKTGVISGAGALIPAGFGTNVVRSAIASAGVNVGLSQMDRFGDYAILKAKGYDELADHATEIDAVSMTADVILGLAFGALHAKNNKKMSITPHEVDLATGAMQEIATDRIVKSDIVTVTDEAHTTAHKVSDRVKLAMEQGENAENSFSITSEEQSLLDRGSLQRGEPEIVSFEGEKSAQSQKVKSTMDVMEHLIETHEASGKTDTVPTGLKRDMKLVQQKVFESAFACFFEHGGQ